MWSWKPNWPTWKHQMQEAKPKEKKPVAAAGGIERDPSRSTERRLNERDELQRPVKIASGTTVSFLMKLMPTSPVPTRPSSSRPCVTGRISPASSSSSAPWIIRISSSLPNVLAGITFKMNLDLALL